MQTRKTVRQRLAQLVAHIPRLTLTRQTVNGAEISVAWQPVIRPVCTDIVLRTTELLTVRRNQVRLSWGQVAYWRDYEVVINWLNPLVWCWHGNGLHLRGKPIERVGVEEGIR